MEADVAIHTPEKWSAGEPCFDQPEKVKFIYSGRPRGEKDVARPVRPRGEAFHYMRVSKSFDDELDGSAAIDVHQMSVPAARSGSQRVKDDLGLSNRRKRGHQEAEGHSKPAHPAAPTTTTTTAGGFRGGDRSPAWERSRLTRDKDGHGVTKREKQAALRDKPFAAAQGRSDKSSNFEELSITEYGEMYDRTDNPWSESERLAPLESHQQKDQSEMFSRRPPKTARQRQGALTPSPASPPSSLGQKSTPMLILEVKDGPTFFYKPSPRMASDTEEGMGATSNTCYNFTSTSRGVIPTAESPAPVRSIHYSSISPRGSPLIGASLSKGSPSLLPRALGLRRPDLSVLKKSSKSSSERLDTSSDSLDDAVLVASSVANVEAGKERKSSPSPPSLQQQSPMVPSSVGLPSHKLSTVEPWQEPVLASRVVTHVEDVPIPQVPIIQQSVASVKPESVGFLNTSEILQQKAGIKHDDIVVGPRRPNSILLAEIQSGLDATSTGDAIKYDSFLGCETNSSAPRQSLLPPKTSGALTGIPALQKRGIGGEPSRRWEPIVFSEQPVSRAEFKSDVKTVRSQETLGIKDTKARPAHDAESGPSSSAESSLERKTPVGGSLDRARWRPKEKRSGIRQPGGRVKKSDNISTDYGYGSVEKRKLTSPEVSVRNYSEQRKLGKLSVETKPTANTACPARQLQSPGASRNKTKPCASAPAKVQHQIPPRLNMLSNIPVPMSHDPPPKRTSKLPQKAHPRTQTPERSAVSPAEVFAAASQSDVVRSSLGSPETSSSTAASAKGSDVNQPPTRYETPPQPGTRSPDPCPASPAALSRKKIPVLQKKPHQAALSSSINNNNNDENSCHDAFYNHDSSKSKENNISLKPKAMAEDAAGKVSGEQPPPHVPAKPRLHRSAEHLFGDATLTVFNSTDNIQSFDGRAGAGVGVGAFKDPVDVDNKMAVDSIGPLKKGKGLARIGILRRGSDRTEMYRRGLDRGVPINDPSGEDLKKATSLKELCQSVASLLNIDNEKAAEMITSSLSQRQDLVEGLDADAILDYLSHHGVLDPAILVGLDKGSNPKQRNSTIIKHVEEHGTTAVALFINALRQSGQLHLASSLDTEQRIKPVSGDGYFGKDRHKGEVTVRVELEALKILAPREPRTDKIVDASLLSSPTRHTGTTTDDEGGPLVRDDLEDDKVKPRSCWCFCFSRKSKVKRASSLPKKKKTDAALREGEASRHPPGEIPHRAASHEGVDRKNPNVKPHRTKSKEKAKKAKDGGTKVASSEVNPEPVEQNKHQTKENAKKSKVTKPKAKSSGKYAVPDFKKSQQAVGPESLPDVHFKTGKDEVFIHGSAGGDAVDPPNTHNGVSPPTSLGRGAKDSWDPIIMEYDPQLELVKLRAGQEELASPTRQYGQAGIMCEQWKSNGRHYLQKASLLCSKIIEELHTEITKYFEQDRGTLVLDVVSDGSAILIFNICMLKAQVRRLQQEVDDGSLITKMEDMFFSKVDITAFDIRGVKLKIVLDDQQASTALSELS